MGFLFSGLFWGVVLVIFGLTIVIKAVFKIDIPIFRIVFALVIIYLGLKMLFGGFGIHKGTSVIFHEAKLRSSGKNGEYNVIFGASDIDLTNIDISKESVFTEVNVVFGSSTVYIDENIPAVIKISTVFADSKLPKGNAGFFGDYVYKTENFIEDENCLTLEVDVVFGSVRIISR